MQALSSSICKYEDISSEWFRRWAGPLEISPVAYGDTPRDYRKAWEWAAILETLQRRGKLSHGMKGIGFAVGTEALPSIMAAHGAFVLASDLAEDEQVVDWSSNNQHGTSADANFRERLISRAEYDRLVSFQPINMANLDKLDPGIFDFAWSSCAFEHIGNLEDGLNFVINAMRLIKPGGVAAHTTEINLSSNDETMADKNMCIYRRRDIEELDRRLRKIRCGIEAMNWDAGCHENDLNYDVPPYFVTGRPHVKLELGGFITTSCLIVVRKGG